MEQKKPTAAQLQLRIKRAVLHIDRTKGTKEVYFDDKGLRLIVTDDEVIVQTGFHSHVFTKFTAAGYSRPCLYIERLVDFAYENDCTSKDGKGNTTRSYKKLLSTLKNKEDSTEYNIAMYVDWYLFNLFQPLYAIGENGAQQFLTYYNYLHNIAAQHIFLDEHKNGMTNKEFVERHNELMADFLKNIEESQIFEPMSDEQFKEHEMEAMKELEIEQNTKE